MKKATVCGFLLLLFSTNLSAQQTTDFLWEMDGFGNLGITGYVGTSRDVVIPRVINGIPVTSIGDEAFEGKQLTSVTLPDSIRFIGNSTFAWNFLTDIVIPGSVIAIGDGAFFENNLTEVTIPPSVEELGSFMFEGNPITSITIGESVRLVRFTMGRIDFGVMGFDDFSFNDAYLSGGSLAGTYTRPDAESRTWTLR